MPKKVFELAKELKMGPLDLVEGLKAKGIAVRNHMSVLEDIHIDVALKEFGDATNSGKSKASKKTTKKKTTKRVVKKTTKKSVGKKDSTKDVQVSSPKKSEVKKISEKSEDTSPRPPLETTPEKSTVIRRKVSDKNSSSQTLSDSLLRKDKILYEEDRPKLKGLTVVSRPELAETALKEETAPSVIPEEKKRNRALQRKSTSFYSSFYPRKKSRDRGKTKKRILFR